MSPKVIIAKAGPVQGISELSVFLGSSGHRGGGGGASDQLVRMGSEMKNDS